MGTAEPNGSDGRVLHRQSVDLRVAWKRVIVDAAVKRNDWGPYDYHRDFNLTFPLQVAGHASAKPLNRS